MENYHKADIVFESGDGGTIQVMEWIREHGCPDLSYTNFRTKNMSSCMGLMVSNHESRHDDDEYIESQGGWFEYNGLKRFRCSIGMWLFDVDGKRYYATT